MSLLGALKCKVDTSTGKEDFHIHTTRSYRSGKKSIFSAVLVKWEGVVAKSNVIVMAIVRLRNQSKEYYMLVVKEYIKVVSVNAHIPYDMLKYDSSDTFHFIPVESISRPVFVIPSIDHESKSKNAVFNAADNRQNMFSRRFYVIPFDRCNKNDQSEYVDYNHEYGSMFRSAADRNILNTALIGDASDDFEGSDSDDFEQNNLKRSRTHE